MDIKELIRDGHSVRAISRMAGRSRNTVRKVVSSEHTATMKPVERWSKLDPFKRYLELAPQGPYAARAKKALGPLL